MKEKRPGCADCVHFRQHYVRVGRGRYAKAGSGHCVYPRLKLRSCGARPCDRFRAIPPEGVLFYNGG